MHIKKKRLLLVALFALAVVFLLLASIPENNEGTPSKNTSGEKNCGIGNVDCHKNDVTSGLEVRTSPNEDDHNFFRAPIFKDGVKLKDSEYENQAKAVAVDGSSDYIYELDEADNDNELDITSNNPADEDVFWMGFGYKDDKDDIYVNIMSDAYTYTKKNSAPVPVAKISIEANFPDDTAKTIVVDDDHDGTEKLMVSLDRDGEVTIYFTGIDSTDEDKDDTIIYQWDLDGDGDLETGDTGEDKDERGSNHTETYSAAGILTLKFQVADGTAESSVLSFEIEIEDTEEKPEIHIIDIAVENDDGEAQTDFEEGDQVSISVEIENKDDSGFGKDTDDPVGVTFYYALKSEGYDTRYELYPTTTDAFLRDNTKTKVSYEWDTADDALDTYKIWIVVDEAQAIDEWNEDNNEAQFDGLVDIEEGAVSGTPIVTFEGDILLDPATGLKANMDITIDVMIKNAGDGTANSAIVEFFINDATQDTSRSFSISAYEEKKLSQFMSAFAWSPSEAGTYDLKLEISYYDGQSNSFTDTIDLGDVSIASTTTEDPDNKPGDNTQDVGEEDSGFLPGFGAFSAALALAGVTILVSRKKRL